MKGSFFSRLFGSDPKPEVKQEPESQAVPDARTETPAPPAPEPASLRMSLSPEHAVNRLWQLRKKQTGWLPSPEFILSCPTAQKDLLPTAKAKQELARLQLAVSMEANKRITTVEPKNNESHDKPPPSPDMDARAAVFLSADRMIAWLFAFPPVGNGKELDQSILEKALEEKQVCYGIVEGLIDSILQDQGKYFHLFHAACGTPVVNGTDGYIVDMFPRKPERKLAVDEHNRVDYASISFIQNVEEGATICRIIPPVPGVAGRTVLDQEIPAKEGRAAAVPKGRNTELSEDGERLLATRTGHVEFNGRGFQVKPVMEIGGDVDFSTGNLNFLGDIHIHGDICAGFVVRAAGSITVEGVVGASTVEAGGDLIMVKGANGSDEAVLRSGGSIYVKYLENCCVYAKDTIHADCIINCDVYCDGGIEVRSGRGVILGGSIRAAHEISASVVGSRGECHTDVFLGGLPCQAFDYGVLIREIDSKTDELLQLERQPDSPTKLSRMAKMRIQISADRMKLEQVSKDLEQLDKAKETPGVRRLVCDVAYPGTSVTIGDVSQRLQREVFPCTAVLLDGEIRFT